MSFISRKPVLITPGFVRGQKKVYGFSQGQALMFSLGALVMYSLIYRFWELYLALAIVFLGLGFYRIWNRLENGQDFLGFTKEVDGEKKYE